MEIEDRAKKVIEAKRSVDAKRIEAAFRDAIREATIEAVNAARARCNVASLTRDEAPHLFDPSDDD